MRRPHILPALVVAVGLVLAVPRRGPGQAVFGGQADWGSTTHLGVGARVLAPVEGTGLEAAGTFDLYFRGGFAHVWELNGNLVYPLRPPEDPELVFYGGGGPNLTTAGGAAEVGLGLVGGLRFPGAGATPFVEARAVLSDFHQLVLTAGLLLDAAGG